ncbi:hypothetical protein [Chitinophaga flava]|nr:hypothetical protein [Chitinophaga flava]
MNLLFIGVIALSLWLVYLQYKSYTRKRSRMLMPVRPANILKINSYTSFGIMATIKFKDEASPQLGERVQKEGDLYKITGVIPGAASEHDGIWDCRLEKL